MNPILLILSLAALAGLLLSNDEKPPSDAPQPATEGNPEPPQVENPTADAGIPESQPLTLDILWEIFDGGARPLRRRDAVEILKAAPYFIPKTNAYRALAPSRRFAAYLREDEQGWLHFAP